ESHERLTPSRSEHTARRRCICTSAVGHRRADDGSENLLSRYLWPLGVSASSSRRGGGVYGVSDIPAAG
ncbi:MAG: hypothetical protein O3B13_22940, partial [Planctomycetota bacterium]|nr:hypothetical protein [Planctomycetota bacterium]